MAVHEDLATGVARCLPASQHIQQSCLSCAAGAHQCRHCSGHAEAGDVMQELQPNFKYVLRVNGEVPEIVDNAHENCSVSRCVFRTLLDLWASSVMVRSGPLLILLNHATFCNLGHYREALLSYLMALRVSPWQVLQKDRDHYFFRKKSFDHRNCCPSFSCQLWELMVLKREFWLGTRSRKPNFLSPEIGASFYTNFECLMESWSRTSSWAASVVPNSLGHRYIPMTIL